MRRKGLSVWFSQKVDCGLMWLAMLMWFVGMMSSSSVARRPAVWLRAAFGTTKKRAVPDSISHFTKPKCVSWHCASMWVAIAPHPFVKVSPVVAAART